MNVLQQKIETWLSREVPKRGLNEWLDLPAVLATDVGLQRGENQDRVAALNIGTGIGSGRPLVVVAVADGMGGMRDGRKCAIRTLSSFFSALISYRHQKIAQRVVSSIAYANQAVFDFAAGKGGSTLCAVLIDNELRPTVVHLGDTRAYSFGSGMSVERLTTDDSLAEIVGGHGSELLQFVGMGAGMQPHVRLVPAGARNVAITTDGIHYIEPDTFQSVISNAADLKSACERISALARWCGGHDNASSAFLNVQSLAHGLRKNDGISVRLWDPFAMLEALWTRDDDISTEVRPPGVNEPVSPTIQRRIRNQLREPNRANPKPKQSTRKAKSRKKTGSAKEDVQLEIQVEPASESEEPGENRK